MKVRINAWVDATTGEAWKAMVAASPKGQSEWLNAALHMQLMQQAKWARKHGMTPAADMDLSGVKVPKDPNAEAMKQRAKDMMDPPYPAALKGVDFID